MCASLCVCVSVSVFVSVSVCLHMVVPCCTHLWNHRTQSEFSDWGVSPAEFRVGLPARSSWLERHPKGPKDPVIRVPFTGFYKGLLDFTEVLRVQRTQ